MNKITLPIILDFMDYHDIDFFQEKLEEIIENIKSEELGCCGPRGRRKYYAIFYLEKDEQYAQLITEYKELEESWENE